MVIHRLETNKLRNVASLFAHLLSTDAISWEVLTCIRLTEEETTSSSRIFIKYLFQVSGHAGMGVEGRWGKGMGGVITASCQTRSLHLVKFTTLGHMPA